MTDGERAYYRRFGITSPAWAVHRAAGRAIRERASRYFRGRMLDVGCGTKAKALLLGDLVDEYVGLDHPKTPHGVDNADLVGTAYEIPAADADFDCVLCTAVLEHLEEPRRALDESFRVLKPGGYSLYTVPLFWPVHEAPRDFYRYTGFGVRHLFERAGFEVIEVAPLSGFWLTFATQWNYWLDAVARGPLRLLARPLIAANNAIAPALDRLDRRFNPFTTRWSWMVLCVGRRPGA